MCQGKGGPGAGERPGMVLFSAEMSASEATPGNDQGYAPTITSRRDLVRLSVGALGVVYGDIGTSPLYAIRECFNPNYGIPPTVANTLGVLSLVFWALVLVVVVKYLTFVMRADNNGDGGILALLALVMPKGNGRTTRRRVALILLGLAGAALLWADGMITPAITVLGAIEGLEVATPVFRSFVVPISLVILVALFLVQKRGTGRIGAMFGPVMMVWFASIAALGVRWIIREPRVLEALNPLWALRLMAEHRLHGFLVLGAVVLCITGTEALYADMGHFGRIPIRVAWYLVVFPGLLINYFGQGALLIASGEAADKNPFYLMAPPFLIYPLVVLATAAAIIASQALISGAFSLAQQGVQLGYSPRLTIVHTSQTARGQIYVPQINTALLVACCGLVLAFQKSTNLAAAYGIAVVGTMATTSVLLYAVARERWKWPKPTALLLTGFFLLVDLTFLFANADKVKTGGWFPLAMGALIFTVMTTWKRGRSELAAKLRSESLSIEYFLSDLAAHMPQRVSGTAVFMTSDVGIAPVVLLHHFKHNKVLHERVLLLSVRSEAVPFIPHSKKVEVHELGHGFFQVIGHYGFMQTPNVPEILRLVSAQGLNVRTSECSFYLGRETLLTTGPARMWRWRKALFGFLSRNALPATAFFSIPPNRVLELGTQIEL
jgi:KUP system potassium uptake protein